MNEKNRAATVARHLEQSRQENEFATPYELVCENLRPQNARARAAAVELLVREFDLHSFDAETVARSVADLSQLKEATRTAQMRRYGQYEVRIIEVDVVTWRILPSLENIRFEGERAWTAGGGALRYGSPISGQPVLGLTHPDPDSVIRTLRDQTKRIWKDNPHSQSIPMRGIEAPGLLSITRLALGDNEKIGVLDATDGFSRTVGAHRGSGIDVDEVLFDLQRDATENKLRNELIHLRDSGEADLGTEAGQVAAARLRSSIMPRAQIIVGYRMIGAAPGRAQPPFDTVRRSLVGHIHLEPPLKFADSTENALKARIALDAVHAADMMPQVPGLPAEDALRLLQSETIAAGGALVGGLHADEVLLLAHEALVSPLSSSRTRVVNTAIHSLTGKRPQKGERAALAADTAMRVNRLALGQELDMAFKGRRSTMQKVLERPTLNKAQLTGRPVLEIRDAALARLREQRENLEIVDSDISADAAELGVLGMYCLVEGVMSLKGGDASPLLTRSSARDESGKYKAEPQQIIQKMVTSEAGLQQLAQTILDVRAHRAPRYLTDGEIAGGLPSEGSRSLKPGDLYRYDPANWAARSNVPSSDDPYRVRDAFRQQLAEGTTALRAIADHLKRIQCPDGRSLVEEEGLALENREWEILDDLAFELRTWNRTAERMSPSVVPSSEEGEGGEGVKSGEGEAA